MPISLCMYWNWGYPLSIVMSMVSGFLWYGPMFNDIWIEYNHFSPKAAKRWQQKGLGQGAHIKTLLSFIAMSSVTQYLVSATNCDTALSGLYLGGLLWIGFAFPLKMVHYAHSPKRSKVVALLDLGFQLFCLLIQCAVIAHFTTTYADSD